MKRWMVLLAIGSASTGCSFARVGAGEVAVVRTPNGVEEQVYSTGDWHIGIWDTPTNYSIRSQEREERLEVLAANGLQVVLDTSIRYHINASEAVALDRELGEHYYNVLLGPTLRSQSRRVVGRYLPEEIYSTQREKIERQVRQGVEEAIKGRHITLEAVLIRNVTLPPAIQAAINNKLEAEQRALKMKYILAQSEAEQQQKLMEMKAQAERDKIVAQTQADNQRLAAQAAADAKRIDAQATSDYEKIVAQHLTPGILRLREIEASEALASSPNTKLLFMNPDSTRPLLDLRGGKKDDAPY